MESIAQRHSRPAAIWRWILGLSGTAALIYLVVDHRPHLFGWLPYLILLACPLMHLFGHRGHHDH
jgi:hypothetical protein